MARIIAIDYGKKRCGIAVTDPLQIIASGLTTVDSKELVWFLKQYTQKEAVEKLVVGYPLNLDDSPTDATAAVEKFVRNFTKVFPNIPVEMVDERYTSAMAMEAMIAMGMKRQQRREKGMIDEISATIILQEYLQSRS
jgi:putative Holliday junction resolvase